MNIAVASGKGGTGKTTVSVNLARAFGASVQLLDCDVEAPNAHLFLSGDPVRSDTITLPIPHIDPDHCTDCGECSRFCEYHAMVSLGTTPLVFPEMCHGCGGCMKVCPTQAITETDHRIGVIEKRIAGHVTLHSGRLDIGATMAPWLIRTLKTRIRADMLTILDAPPGTACPVIATLRNVDFVLLVTEPTPFGHHDLTIAVDTVRDLKIPFGVVINRMGAGDDRVHRYCAEEKIPILLEIPDDRRIAEAYSRGVLMVDHFPEYRSGLTGLIRKITTICQSTNHLSLKGDSCR